eukprot:SAG31_NODE_42216_length_272_cov_1.173410_1_plen_59_part_10
METMDRVCREIDVRGATKEGGAVAVRPAILQPVPASVPAPAPAKAATGVGAAGASTPTC